jgi:hypothetical protein
MKWAQYSLTSRPQTKGAANGNHALKSLSAKDWCNEKTANKRHNLMGSKPREGESIAKAAQPSILMLHKI